MKYTEIGVEPESVTYEVGNPSQFEDRFNEIQDLRTAYYAMNFIFPDGQRRSIREVRNFVNQLTFKVFADPQLSVGSTSRAFQEYKDPIAALALHNGDIVGVTRGARNASSRLQRELDTRDISPAIGRRLGKIERKWKFARNRDLVWIAEEVHDPALPIMGPVCTDIFLSEYNQGQISSQWPYNEEQLLIDSLKKRGYAEAEDTVDDVDVERQFGVGARATKFALWLSPPLTVLRQNLVEGEPVLASEIVRAHKSLEKIT